MASKCSLCDVCSFRQISKPSVVWCSECDEGLCVECEEHHAAAKVTRTHGTVPISDYHKLPTNVIEVSTFCSDHNEKYIMYCKKHDSPCCGRCMVENHLECKDVGMFDDIIKGAKSSNNFLELEEILTETVENIYKFRKYRQENLISLKEERENIVKEIHQTRIKINSHLDKIQEELIKEVYEAEEKESTAIRSLLSQLEQKENEVKEFQQTLSNLKLHASDLQTYLALRQMEQETGTANKSIYSLFRDNHSKQIILTCQIVPTLQNFSNSIQKFGNVITKLQESKFTVLSKKDKQAQIEITEKPPSYDSISLQLKQTYNIESSDIRGCSILPGGKCIFCCFDKGMLVVLKPDGTKDFQIRFKDPVDIAYIEKSDSVVVTVDYRKTIALIDIKEQKVTKSIDLKSCVDGITVLDEALIFCARWQGVRELNLRDNAVKDIVNTNTASYSFIATHKDNIYYTHPDIHSVTCLDLKGMEKWKFSKRSILKRPIGIAVDGDGNVFVAGYNSQNVIVISADGQSCKQLLSAKDGIRYPTGMHYNHSTNTLLIADCANTGRLFDIVKEMKFPVYFTKLQD